MKAKLLIANRGAIACRILRTAKRMGIPTVAIYSDPDRDTLPVRLADESVRLPGSTPAETYLNQAAVLQAMEETNSTVVHPGYGFLSENAEFAESVEAKGCCFAGPYAKNLREFGLKDTARDLAQKAGVPLLPGTPLLENGSQATQAASSIGLPVILKSTAGGGGIGMRICRSLDEVNEAFDSVSRLGESNFSNAGVFLESFVERARHVEVQIFGDGEGKVVALGERDCSAQRRNQKVVEEAPAPNLRPEVRHALHEAAVSLASSVSYRSAGTVEFLYDEKREQFYFLEVNTRLQVEHGVTEEVFGVDLVEWMLRLSLGETAFLADVPQSPQGHSIQVRLYAEDPARNFQPSTGTVTHLHLPDSVRVESWLEQGSEVSSFYDPMLAKLIATGADRSSAIGKLLDALTETEVAGIVTNADYLADILSSKEFADAAMTTSFLKDFPAHLSGIEVIDGGIESILVDWPGRTGYWGVGVPPSGPFDDRSFRLANVAVGNAEGACGLEMAVRGPTLRFHDPAIICLSGAEMGASLDGQMLALGQVIEVKPGQTLTVGSSSEAGLRGYLVVAGGFDVPSYLGSRTTFPLGLFGGHCGRRLRAGDSIYWQQVDSAVARKDFVPDALSNEWTLAVSYGPHAAPEFFTEHDMDVFFSTQWEVHYNSSRTGVRLIGPKPQWARPDGGEAGLHPSNIHDNAYQVGAVDFTGDMPIILGPDGPSLGGFVCPATVVSGDLWKVGQLRPGDKVRFHPVPAKEFPRVGAEESHRLQVERESPIYPGRQATYRRQGDTGVLIEFGEMTLDLELRFMVQEVYDFLSANPFSGVLDLTPGIRSLQVRFDPSRISFADLVQELERVQESFPPLEGAEVPTRTVHLPLCWDDVETRRAIEKYMQVVRPDAPWCPSNIEFIRRINGLKSIDEVRRIVFEASYLVMGLGDVYLGAPVATPLDPRHRLVTTKYNPARTWTPENAVGIGGAYMCIYGMEGPGGYQFVGRTVPVWNRFRTTPVFGGEKPWLLRLFDQIRFFPVEHEQLNDLRRDILTGKYIPEITHGKFILSEYRNFLLENADSIAAFRAQQKDAFNAERLRWKEADQKASVEEPVPQPKVDVVVPEGALPVTAATAGSLWKILVKAGDAIERGAPAAILESMKTEITCPAPATGKVVALYLSEGQPVTQGDLIAAIQPLDNE